MKVQIEPRSFNYRKESFTIKFHYYLCEDSGEKFEDENFSALNNTQVLNKFRAKHNIPFAHEIIELRNKYGLSASKMSEILGLGTNTYRKYENGEIPSTANARLLQLVSDPKELLRLVEISNALKEKERIKLDRCISIFKTFDKKYMNRCRFLFVSSYPSELNGFKKFDFAKTAYVSNIVTSATEAFKTKLNKLLFYIDFEHFRRYGHSITGLQYNAISWGPVPNNFSTIFEQLVNFNILNREYWVFPNGTEGEKYLPGSSIEELKIGLEKSEKETVDFVLKKLGGYSAADLSKISHEEIGWLENKESNGPINYEYSFDLKALNT